MATNTNALYEALKAQFEAQRQKAIATLTVYLTNPVGIGEHPQIIDEMVEQTKSLAEAEDCLERLKDTFEVNETKSEGINE
jgi:methylaspartate ammonia-lyase